MPTHGQQRENRTKGLEIEIDSDELPILDGSAKIFIEKIFKTAGLNVNTVGNIGSPILYSTKSQKKTACNETAVDFYKIQKSS